jgi:hypothetical protein
MTKARDLSKLLSTANGKIAGANLDVSFENITDTGTEGTKIASGTTGQRGSTAGQLRFNSDTGLAEYYNGSAFKAIDNPPIITSVDVTSIETNLGGTETFVINGSNFQSGVSVKLRGNNGTLITPDTETRNSENQITITKTRSSFSNVLEPYDIIITNTSGLAGTLSGQISVDNTPTWITASGQIGNALNGTALSASVSATDPDGDTIVYTESGGSVLSANGLSLNSASGAITGTLPVVGSNTTYNFSLQATAGLKNTTRSFSIINKALTTNALLLDSTNNTAIQNKITDNSYLSNPASTEVTLTNGNLRTPSIVTNGSYLAGAYNQSNIIDDDQWASQVSINPIYWLGIFSGYGSYATDVWATFDFGANPSFRINRLTGRAEWRTNSADFRFYGSNDVSGYNNSNSFNAVGATQLFNLNSPAENWDSGNFGNTVYYRYYTMRILLTGGGGYDWGWSRTKIYGDYY